MPTSHDRRYRDIVFGLCLVSGVMVGGYVLWGLADLIHSQGEDAFGLYYLGLLSFVPTVLAGIACGLQAYRAPRERNVRLALTLIAVHLVWWALVIGIELVRDDPTWGWAMRIATIGEPALYATAITALAAGWFWSRREAESRDELGSIDLEGEEKVPCHPALPRRTTCRRCRRSAPVSRLISGRSGFAGSPI